MQNRTIFSVLIAATLGSSCDIPPKKDYQTYSAIYNELLDAAAMDVVDLDVKRPQTLRQIPKSPFCPVDKDGISFGGVSDSAFLDDSTVVFISSSRSLMARLNLNTGRTHVVAQGGQGPGELQGGSVVAVQSDGVYVIDRVFWHQLDQNLNFVNRMVAKGFGLYTSVALNDSLIIVPATPAEYTASIKVLHRSDNFPVYRELFSPVVDPFLAGRAGVGFNSVFMTYNRNRDRILFKYFAKPFLFISDLEGNIERTVRVESAELRKREPDYDEGVMQQLAAGGAGERGIGSSDTWRWSENMAKLRLMDDGSIRIVYRNQHLVELRFDGERYSMGRHFVFARDGGGNPEYLNSMDWKNDRIVGSAFVDECLYVFEAPRE